MDRRSWWSCEGCKGQVALGSTREETHAPMTSPLNNPKSYVQPWFSSGHMPRRRLAAPPNHHRDGRCSFISHMQRNTSCPRSHLQSTQLGRTSADQCPSMTGTSTAYGCHLRRWWDTQIADDQHGERQTRTLGMDCSLVLQPPNVASSQV